MTALHDLSAVELLARYRERSLSPVDVTRAVLDRIAAWEPHLHATYALDGDAALAAAAFTAAAGAPAARFVWAEPAPCDVRAMRAAWTPSTHDPAPPERPPRHG